jgi:hypothetical protein
MQNIANQVQFDKERYMLVFNDFVKEYIPKCQTFLMDMVLFYSILFFSASFARLARV